MRSREHRIKLGASLQKPRSPSSPFLNAHRAIPFSPGEKGAKFKVPLPRERDLG